MKRRICGTLLAVAVVLTSVNFPAAANAEDNRSDSGVAVAVTGESEEDTEQKDGPQTIHVSAANSCGEDAVLRTYLEIAEDASADTETEALDLNDAMKDALTLADGTNTALDAQWVEKTDDGGNVTARYLEAALPAGAVADFDMQLMYRTDEENYTRTSLVKAKAFVDEQDVTRASDQEDEDNETEVVWEMVQSDEVSEAGSAEIEESAVQTTEENIKETPVPVKNMAAKADASDLNQAYVYLDPKGMTAGNCNWTDSQATIYMAVETWTKKQKAVFDDSTGYWYWDTAKWDNTDHPFYFTINDGNGDYCRTAELPVNLTNAKGKIFSWDGTSSEVISGTSWQMYVLKEGIAFDPDDHTAFAGETVWFDDHREIPTGSVTAVFYEKGGNGELTLVSSVQMNRAEDPDKNQFSCTIPTQDCSYVQFKDTDDNILGYQYFNFYGQGEDETDVFSFIYNAGSAYCYTYTGDKETSSWGIRSNGLEIYFDAALSKLSYQGDVGEKGIPAAGEQVICHAYNSATDYQDVVMSRVPQTVGGNTWNDVYVAQLNERYMYVTFYSSTAPGSWPTGTDSKKTTDQTINWDLEKPCFYADTSDDAAYKNAARDGCWAEACTIRNPETEAEADGGTVVDVEPKEQDRQPDMLYVNTTLYDYYTDYELNGNNRDNYDTNVAFHSHRIYQPFRQFNQALSDYYRENGTDSALYWGNFQNFDGAKFEQIADTLDLYGWNDRNKFFYENNSMWGIDGSDFKSNQNSDIKVGKVATQGLVSGTMSGDRLAMDTPDGSVPAPFFDKDFLQGANSKNTELGRVYENVSFPFVKLQLGSLSEGDNNTGDQYGTVDYWYFNSNTTEVVGVENKEKLDNQNLRLYKDSDGNYFLDAAETGVKGETADGDDGTTTAIDNYFPLNTEAQSGQAKRLNYGFGQKLEIPFRLTEDGTVPSNKTDQATGEAYQLPIEFNFSGDDDVWVFIDGQLVLDVGGGHGIVTGRINFADRTSWVSAVKNSGNGGAQADVTADFPESLKNDNDFYKKEHTLTIYYMERGLWESNLRMSFNFPDQNEFTVEKQVDDSAADPIFHGLFDNKQVFPFVIENQATHYEGKEVSSSGFSEPRMYNTTFTGKVSSSNSATKFKASDGNEENTAAPVGAGDFAYWKSNMDDMGRQNRDQRFGIIYPAEGETFDASGVNAYLQFKTFFWWNNDTPALSYMYIQLEDADGTTIGGYLNGKTYGTTTLRNNAWDTVQVELDRLARDSDKGDAEFDYSKIANIKFSYDKGRQFFLDDFRFIPSVETEGKSGFVTKQYLIPDYGSAESGHLEKPAGAQYTLERSAGTAKNYQLTDSGLFALGDGDSAVYRDQFRRGSYIALREEVNEDVFDTSWTLYENGKPVTESGEGSTVNTDEAVQPLTDQEGRQLRDGRKEIYWSGQGENGQEISNQGYNETGWAKDAGNSPTENTIVFRSYSDPDNTSSTTKLKAVFTNKLKVGEIILKKEAAEGSAALSGIYTFRVTYTNVAGMSLEDEPITQEYSIDLRGGEAGITIDGIPVGTEYRIEEIRTSDGSTLKNVLIGGSGQDDAHYDPDTKTVTGRVTASADVRFPELTFQNTLEPTIDINLEKVWKDTGQADLSDKISVRLQRSEDGTTWGDVEEASDLSPDYDGYWKKVYRDLPKYVDYQAEPQILWKYRIVELDGDGAVIEDGGYLDRLFRVTYSDPVSGAADQSEPAEGGYDYKITNTYSPAGKVTIIKKDETDTLLGGAEFSLYPDDDGKPGSNAAKDLYGAPLTGSTGEAEGDAKGKLVFDNIPAGTEDAPKIYWLVETKTKPGYVLLKEPIKITLPYKYDAGAVVNGEKVTESGVAWELTYTIINGQAFDLPESGSKGVGPLAAAGIATVVLAAGIYTARNIKEQKKAPRRDRRRRS